MFWLVLYYTSVVVIPETYLTEQACIAAGELWVNKQYKCIPSNFNCLMFKSIDGGRNGITAPSRCDPPTASNCTSTGNNTIVCK